MKLYQDLKLQELGMLNPLITDYLMGKSGIERLYTHKPEMACIQAAIDAKQSFSNREVLVDALYNQYSDFDLSAQTQQNIEALKKENTYSVCAAHQLCLFTGPSYFIFKILSAIKLSQELKAQFPQYNFVPVYWMGSEDHDFEEISKAVLYGKPITWENDEKGAVGRHSLKGINLSIDKLSDLIASLDHGEKFIGDLKQFFSGDGSYGKAFQAWILDLFKSYGLLVVDQDDAQLKRLIQPIIKAELLDGVVQKNLKSNEAFLDRTYHVQANSRDLNLFYLKDQIRARIERNGNDFVVVNTSLIFTEKEMLSELKEYPERFSPNVFLRPIYQETILPNVAFIGGPGEIAYWLQLKNVFDFFKVSQPLILLRDMAVMMNSSHLQKIKDWKIEISDLFTHYDQIAKNFIAKESQNELSLVSETESIQTIFSLIKSKAVKIDKNMERSVDAEKQKVLNSLSNIESKLIRAEKRNFEQQLNQLENIQNKLLPNKILQERSDNFIPIYLKNKDAYFEKLLESFNPFEQSLKVFEI